MTKVYMENVTAALQVLGVSGEVCIKDLGLNRIEVSVNNEYFGIFDVVKNTFVD